MPSRYPMKLDPHNRLDRNSLPGRTLLALRAGPLTRQQVQARLSSDQGLKQLLRAGLACERVRYGHYTYCITDAGRAQCPTRRSAVDTATPATQTTQGA